MVGGPPSHAQTLENLKGCQVGKNISNGQSKKLKSSFSKMKRIALGYWGLDCQDALGSF